jgi:predicted nucleic acid-binding protein
VRQVLETERGPLIIPAPVTAEVDYLVRQRAGPDAGRRFLEDLAMGRLLVASMTLEEHGLALALSDRYKDFNLGLADLSVVVLAHRYRTRRILTFDDRHFRAITALDGTPFTILPADL